jgi:tRNA dimethylallyltransferase
VVQKIIIICGPTAVGKTRVSIELAERFKGEIVSADSQQVWRGMDIGTAKANLTERFRIPHHLIDVADPDEHFDAAKFLELADRSIADIASRGKLPFVVGGTGMYLRMLVNGLCEAPPQDSRVRKQIEDEIDAQGLPRLHQKLSAVDPESGLNIHPNDRTRIVRALEIYELTGIPANDFRKVHCYSEQRYDALKVGLNIEREELYHRINDHIDRMLEEGLLDEVRGLMERYGPDAQGLRAVGYREFVRHLEGEISLHEATHLAKRNSRRFAKRQLTWFRADDEIKWFAPNELHRIVDVMTPRA